jgi:hypothetical protein
MNAFSNWWDYRNKHYKPNESIVQMDKRVCKIAFNAGLEHAAKTIKSAKHDIFIRNKCIKEIRGEKT